MFYMLLLIVQVIKWQIKTEKKLLSDLQKTITKCIDIIINFSVEEKLQYVAKE